MKQYKQYHEQEGQGKSKNGCKKENTILLVQNETCERKGEEEESGRKSKNKVAEVRSNVQDHLIEDRKGKGEKIKCSFADCGHEFYGKKKKDSRKRHEKEHSNDKKWLKCDDCHLKFFERELAKHNTLEHGKGVKCERCGISFKYIHDHLRKCRNITT